ncbi:MULTISPECIES: hypothetical protein [Lactobacillus]|uniref:hypothetical protein n=1 Tax=Lactobacillus TaxID=1578 RepID=UPI0024928997|nr:MULTISPECIES: hypothetical protein [Lactobacillus]
MKTTIKKRITVPSSTTIRLNKKNREYLEDIMRENNLTSINQGINKALEQVRLINNIDGYLSKFEYLPADIKSMKFGINVLLEMMSELCYTADIEEIVNGTQLPIYKSAVEIYHQNAKSNRLKKLSSH